MLLLFVGISLEHGDVTCFLWLELEVYSRQIPSSSQCLLVFGKHILPNPASVFLDPLRNKLEGHPDVHDVCVCLDTRLASLLQILHIVHEVAEE